MDQISGITGPQEARIQNHRKTKSGFRNMKPGDRNIRPGTRNMKPRVRNTRPEVGNMMSGVRNTGPVARNTRPGVRNEARSRGNDVWSLNIASVVWDTSTVVRNMRAMRQEHEYRQS